ncbi:MAG: ATP-binding cassette domain-containing protein [Anaerolineae bacterium]|nr:ATP-binding cassette domain-containing protein [Anaerolineae bacterium]
MIELDGVTFAYSRGSTPVFESFCWAVGQGESWAVVGPSGSGKSTLLYLIAGLREPGRGRVLIEGEPASSGLRRGAVGLVLQDYGLLPWATALENAALGLRVRRMYGIPTNGASVTPEGWLERLGIAHLRGKYPSQLSGGERQRVAIARALALGPRVLLLDEPFSALDALQREDMERLTLAIGRETGATTVFVTHSIEEAVYVGRRILVLRWPPNRVATVVDNPASGGGPTADVEAMARKCAEVREVLTGEAGL